MDIEEQYDKIYHYCYFKIYDKQLAQDITQETFLRFYKQEFLMCSQSSIIEKQTQSFCAASMGKSNYLFQKF